MTSGCSLVVGGNGPVGLAVIDRLLDTHARVISTYRRSWHASAMERGDVYQLDLEDADAINRVLAKLAIARVSLRSVVFVASATSRHGLSTFSPKNARIVFEVNVIAPLRLLSGLVECRLLATDCAVVMLTSAATIAPRATGHDYVASKGALDAVVRSLALELAPDVRVNAVAPGVLEREDRSRRAASKIPLRRLGLPQDVANAVGFLTSPEAGYITGQVVVVDGGLTIRGGTDEA